MLKGSGLRGRRTLRFHKEEVNPMDGIANLTDVMLVFACGLMVALILNWNVDLNKTVDIINEDELVEVQNPEEAIKNGGISQNYNEKGIVYEDPKTGKMYVISP